MSYLQYCCVQGRNICTLPLSWQTHFISGRSMINDRTNVLPFWRRNHHRSAQSPYGKSDHLSLPSFKRGVIKRLHCPFRWKDRISVKYFLLAVVAMHCPFMSKYSHVRTIPLSFYSRWNAPAFSIYGFFSGGGE
jgi:hypothetical protein